MFGKDYICNLDLVGRFCYRKCKKSADRILIHSKYVREVLNDICTFLNYTS